MPWCGIERKAQALQLLPAARRTRHLWAISVAGGRVLWLCALIYNLLPIKQASSCWATPRESLINRAFPPVASKMQSKCKACVAQLLPPSIGPLRIGFDRGPFLWWTGRYFFCGVLPETNWLCSKLGNGNRTPCYKGDSLYPRVQIDGANGLLCAWAVCGWDFPM